VATTPTTACHAVKDKQGKVITTEREQAARWVQHFEEVLNRADPEVPADPPPSQSYLDIDTSPPGIAEVRSTIENMKNGEAPGIDSLQGELFKADISTTSRLLMGLFSKIWEQEVIPKDWTKGLVFTLPKKGDLRNCDNWRRITLLSVPNKMFCSTLTRLSVPHSEKNRLVLEEEKVVKHPGTVSRMEYISLHQLYR